MASQCATDFDVFAVVCCDSLTRPFGTAGSFMQEVLRVVRCSDALRSEAGHFDFAADAASKEPVTGRQCEDERATPKRSGYRPEVFTYQVAAESKLLRNRGWVQQHTLATVVHTCYAAQEMFYTYPFSLTGPSILSVSQGHRSMSAAVSKDIQRQRTLQRSVQRRCVSAAGWRSFDSVAGWRRRRRSGDRRRNGG